MIVIDTNVIAVANNKFPELSENCIESSQLFLLKAMKSETILIDSDLEIIREYQSYASRAGQPGVGDLFFTWLWNNAFSNNNVKQIDITPTFEENFLYSEIPQNENLIGFDRSDQKFLATALKVHPTARIINASDSDWEEFEEGINELGVEIEMLC